MAKRSSNYPKEWASLPDQHHKTIKELVHQFTKLHRWPTYPELARVLGRSKSSIECSMEYLQRKKLVSIDSYGRGVPPSINVKGFTVMLQPYFINPDHLDN